MFLLVTIPFHGFVSVVGKKIGKFKVYLFSVVSWLYVDKLKQ